MSKRQTMQRDNSRPPRTRCSSPADPLTDVLHSFRLEDTFYCRSLLRSPWGIRIPQRPCAGFHFVAEGSAWVLTKDERIRLERGDLVFFLTGIEHIVASSPDTPVADMDSLPCEQIGPRSAGLQYGGSGARSLLICGGMRFDPEDHPIRIALPSVLVLRCDNVAKGAWINLSIATMREEASASRVGGECFLTRLAELLLIEAIRGWLQDSPEAQRGWLAALSDPQLGRVLTLMHRQSEEPWSIAKLAREAAMSKSVFCERFRTTVGMSPLRYLRNLRMQLAARWMKERRMTIGEVAQRFGYGSEAAFSRAFKRFTGVPPGLAKRQPTGMPQSVSLE